MLTLLSLLATIQAPVIMMSQNRQEEKDRLRARNDYKTNSKTEIIIEDLYQKVDVIISNQEIILQELQKTGASYNYQQVEEFSSDYNNGAI